MNAFVCVCVCGHDLYHIFLIVIEIIAVKCHNAPKLFFNDLY